ncbi:hypothetical protein BT96DRAFT_1027656 [Gymnopus androsaceus JB14]|uniref:HAT C-terminal dimerisation domain-containing protein n=1 Tax=Gymnopus androsaceus JB14 TaxID=1447944 RepID=A0A6A4GAB4_9AGAR|nr:hypothetical protein BT96DRAFT_1027656 [Gymnopus androsaceus JB14]
MCTAEFKQMADDEGCIVDLLALWRRQGAITANGRGGLVGLALRILQMVGNSASTECTFSVFGLTHSKIRNRLAPDTVHDITLVRMDRHREHKEAGVVYTRKKRKFGDSEPEVEPTAEQEDEDTPSSTSDVFFSLIVAATADNEDDDSDDDDLHIPAPTPAPTLSTTARIPKYKKITLADLFAYPSATDIHQPFHFYQAHGHASLDMEEEEVAGMFANDA